MSTQTLSVSNTEAFDSALESLAKSKQRWTRLPIGQKIKYLEKVYQAAYQCAQTQVEFALQAKDNQLQTPWEGEEWLSGPVVQLRNIRLLLEKLKQVAKFGIPQLQTSQIQYKNHQLRVKVFPETKLDQWMYQGISAEVWQKKDLRPQQLAKQMAVAYQNASLKPQVALVLGAGNVASIAPLDVLYKLFVEEQVVLLKLNPVNEYLDPIWQQIFQPLIDEGFMQILSGDATLGARLCQDRRVDRIHVTGSYQTYQAIQQSIQAHPVPVTAELGNVSPVIVVPGQWSKKAIRFQAKNVASQLANNAGFNCNAARVLILHEQWPQKEEFIQALVHALEKIPLRHAYYPGAKTRYGQFLAAYDQIIEIGHPNERELPWALITNVNAKNQDEFCFQQESFCSVMAQTSIKAETPQQFIEDAVNFCNQKCFGSLNACIIIDPKTQYAMSDTVEQAIADLKYGTVAINVWPALAFALGTTTWGAHPEQPQSGVGVVHNAYMFESPEKSVVRGPFLSFPQPPWFCGQKNTTKVAKALLEYEYKPSMGSFLRVLVHALI